MKTPRSLLTLLLLTACSLFHHETARAQSVQDSIFLKPELSAALYTWQFGVYHRGTTPVNQIILWIDQHQYPNVAFTDAAIVGSLPGMPSPAFTQNWASGSAGGVSATGDSAYWCSTTDFIGHNQSDEWFDFQLSQINPNIPMSDSPIVIHWYTNFASNECSTSSNVSSGEITVIPLNWQNLYPLDTVTATSKILADCDPSFNFTVHNRASGFAIDHMQFQLLTPSATMRPSEIVPPPGWSVQDVTQTTAMFATTNGGILSQNSLSGFVLGLRALTSSTPYPIPFVWSAFNGSAIIDRDTTWDTAASVEVAPCAGSENPSEDTLTVAHARDCNFNFKLINLHSGELSHTTSRITAFRLQITSPSNVTWSEATNPSLCWHFTPQLGGQTLTFHAISSPQTESMDSATCGIPGGTDTVFFASINDPNPGEPVTVHWVRFQRTECRLQRERDHRLSRQSNGRFGIRRSQRGLLLPRQGEKFSRAEYLDSSCRYAGHARIERLL